MALELTALGLLFFDLGLLKLEVLGHMERRGNSANR